MRGTTLLGAGQGGVDLVRPASQRRARSSVRNSLRQDDDPPRHGHSDHSPPKDGGEAMDRRR
eukprot:9241109-Pyramimonas_sp.AAC.1